MRRYRFLDKSSVHNALNKLRASFLAAKDGDDVEEIIKGILTYDERMKIGRRIEIAELIREDMQYREIAKTLKVGLTTVMLVVDKIQKYPRCFNLIMTREDKVKNVYKSRAYRKTGGSKFIFGKKIYAGFTRKDVKR